MTKMAEKWLKSIPNLWPKRLTNHPLWGRTYLYSPYKGVPPGGGAGGGGGEEDDAWNVFAMSQYGPVVRSELESDPMGQVLLEIKEIKVK